MRAKRIPYVIVGDTSEYPGKIGSDVDIVVQPSITQDLHKIINDFAVKEGLSLVQLLQHEVNAWYFVLLWGDKSPSESIALDICGDYVRDGKPFVCAGDLLLGRQVAKTADGLEKGFYVAAPEIEFIYYLVKKVDKGTIDQRQFSHLKGQYTLSPEGCMEGMCRYWSLETSRAIGDWLQNNDLTSLTQAILELKASLTSCSKKSFKQRALEFYRKVRRVLQPTGVVVALLGPDGCGKSAIGDRFVVDIVPAFRGVKRFHLRPSIIGTGSSVGVGEPVIDPHGKAPRGVLPSVAKILFFLADYLVGYWGKIRPLKVRSHLVLFDRYYHDMLVDPKRYRYGAPMGFARFAARFIPKPDMFLVLDAPADVIHSRKQEVSFAETERQREAYLTFAKNNPNCVVLNTNQDIDATLKEACSAVHEFMEQRLSRRLDLR
jgi:thymidylate kinase